MTFYWTPGVKGLNWGSTRIAEFLTRCFLASKIIIPLPDTIITMNIWPDETAFISSVKGTFTPLQLFSDLHIVFVNYYLHKLDSGPSKTWLCSKFCCKPNTRINSACRRFSGIIARRWTRKFQDQILNL